MAVARISLSHHRPTWLPLAATLLGIALFSVMDAVMKRASIAAGVYPALFARSLVGIAVLAPLWWKVTAGRLPPRRVLRLHLLRGTIAAGMAAAFFYGIVRTPLAQGIALSFIAPLLALGLASLLLGERIRRAALGAALLGLLGVAVLAAGRLRDAPPGPEAPAGLAAILISALLYAWNLVVQRQQAQVSPPVEIALSQNVVIAAVLGVGALVRAGWSVARGADGASALAALLVPPAAAWPDIAAAALLASVSLMLLAWAYARAEAQALVPLEYSAFLWAALMGWWWFGEAVTGWTLAGLALILFGVWHGTRAADPDARPAPDLGKT